jgi:hypothetical protein
MAVFGFKYLTEPVVSGQSRGGREVELGGAARFASLMRKKRIRLSFIEVTLRFVVFAKAEREIRGPTFLGHFITNPYPHSVIEGQAMKCVGVCVLLSNISCHVSSSMYTAISLLQCHQQLF